MKNKSIIIGIYALLILIGGLIGFFVAGSLASLLSGVISGLILFGCSYFVRQNNLKAYDITLGVICFLLIFFFYRFIITQKIAPSGVLFLLTSFLLIYLGRTRPTQLISN